MYMMRICDSNLGSFQIYNEFGKYEIIIAFLKKSPDQIVVDRAREGKTRRVKTTERTVLMCSQYVLPILQYELLV